MTEEEKVQLPELIANLEELEKKTRGTNIPRDIFWHKESVQILKELLESIEKETHTLRKTDAQKEAEGIRTQLVYILEELTSCDVGSGEVDATDIRNIQRSIRTSLEDLDKRLLRLIERLQYLEKHRRDDPYRVIKQQLTKWHFSWIRHKDMLALFDSNWPEVKKSIDILGNSRIPSRKQFYPFWDAVVEYAHLATLISYPQQEIDKIRKEVSGSKTSDEIYKDPDFLDNLKEFWRKSRGRKSELAAQNQKIFGSILLTFAKVYAGSEKSFGVLSTRQVHQNIVEGVWDKESFLQFCALIDKIYDIGPAAPYLALECQPIFNFVWNWNFFESLEQIAGNFKNYSHIKTWIDLCHRTQSKIRFLSVKKSIVGCWIFCKKAPQDKLHYFPMLVVAFLPLVKEGKIKWFELCRGIAILSNALPANAAISHNVVSVMRFLLDSKITWEMLLTDYPKMARRCGNIESANSMFLNALPEFIDIIGTRITWKQVSEGLPEICKNRGDKINHMFPHKLGGLLKHLGGSKEIPNTLVTWDEFVQGWKTILDTVASYRVTTTGPTKNHLDGVYRNGEQWLGKNILEFLLYLVIAQKISFSQLVQAAPKLVPVLASLTSFTNCFTNILTL